MSAGSPLTLLFTALYLFSIYFFYKKRFNLALVFLLLGSFFLRLDMAMMDPFIHNWDERFHALVAKNMMQDPFRPLLYKYPAIAYDHKAWCCNHIWVHKQPLFLWQIALSMKLFGVNEIALRLPSVLMGAGMVYFTWRIGWLATLSKTVAYISAFLISMSWYQLELTSGLTSLDHNDIAFSFYITGSIWSYAEYLRTGERKWALLAGLFSGGAILCKWLVGLLVYAGWGSVTLFLKENRNNTRRWIDLGLAVLITAIVALPWQLYILSAFPVEAAYEYEYNTRHLFEVLEGHDHEWWFFFFLMPIHFGKYFIPFLIVGAFWLMLRPGNKQLSLALVSNFLIVYLFFSIVPTKLQSFTFIVAPIAFVFIATAIGRSMEKLRERFHSFHFVIIPLIIFLGIYCLKPWNIRKERTPENSEREAEIHNATVYRSLPDSIEGSKTVVINNREHRNIELMFYKNVTAYPWYLDARSLDSLHNAGYRIYTFPAYANDSLPGFIREREFIKILPEALH